MSVPNANSGEDTVFTYFELHFQARQNTKALLLKWESINIQGPPQAGFDVKWLSLLAILSTRPSFPFITSDHLTTLM